MTEAEALIQMTEAVSNLVVMVTNYRSQLMSNGFPEDVANAMVVALHTQIVAGIARG